VSNIDEETRQHLLNGITVSVRSGFDTEAEILEAIPQRIEDEIGESDTELLADLLGHARKLLAEQRECEEQWRERTMNDAINDAFEELDANGLVALQNAGYTQSDGWDDVNEIAAERDPPPRGAAFYHGQDLERGVAGQGLFLTFGAYVEGAEHEAAIIVVGRQICETLGRHGVQTRWDGTTQRRIEIPPFEWQRRRAARAH
jgi:hypothetical protein